jgi:hypothetical protein
MFSPLPNLHESHFLLVIRERNDSSHTLKGKEALAKELATVPEARMDI